MKQLSCAVMLSALVSGAVAETDFPWLFDETGRAGSFAPPSAVSAAGASDAACSVPAWIEAVVSGVVPFGMMLFIR